ncbi:MAG TPA: formate dehydrogenase accessory sulfurtransferase FdhD [Actinomycetota bacterium]|nr:formate dehydrogenase accessory sulfurtransferase FdhD [Actinomycetota bacterium]
MAIQEPFEPDAAEAKRERIGRPGASTKSRVVTYEGGELRRRSDAVATEEPLEIRLHHGGDDYISSVTMRTPGNDFELATGWLLAEGIVREPDDVTRIAYCVDRSVGEEQRYNIVNVYLRPDPQQDFASIERDFFTTSACGVCGKAGLDQLATKASRIESELTVPSEIVCSLPGRLRTAQGVFERTGGLHAAGLFDSTGELLGLREDVGRHNALDKLLGWALLERKLPLSDCIVLVSGRASFELAQKSVVAGVPVMCAVSAPSSLAIEVARDFNMTLVGFLRDERFNVYTGADRIQGAP